MSGEKRFVWFHFTPLDVDDSESLCLVISANMTSVTGKHLASLSIPVTHGLSIDELMIKAPSEDRVDELDRKGVWRALDGSGVSSEFAALQINTWAESSDYDVVGLGCLGSYRGALPLMEGVYVSGFIDTYHVMLALRHAGRSKIHPDRLRELGAAKSIDVQQKVLAGLFGLKQLGQ